MHIARFGRWRLAIALAILSLPVIFATTVGAEIMEPDGAGDARSSNVVFFGDANKSGETNSKVRDSFDNMMTEIHGRLEYEAVQYLFGLGDYGKDVDTANPDYLTNPTPLNTDFLGVEGLNTGTGTPNVPYFGESNIFMVGGDNERLQTDWSDSHTAGGVLDEWDDHIFPYNDDATSFESNYGRYWYQDIYYGDSFAGRVIGIPTKMRYNSGSSFPDRMDGTIGYFGEDDSTNGTESTLDGDPSNSALGNFLDDALQGCSQPTTIVVVMHESFAWDDDDGDYTKDAAERGFGKDNSAYYGADNDDSGGVYADEEVTALLSTLTKHGVDVVVSSDTHVFRNTVMQGWYDLDSDSSVDAGETRDITFLQVPPTSSNTREVDDIANQTEPWYVDYENVPYIFTGETDPDNYYPGTGDALSDRSFYLDMSIWRGGVSTNQFYLRWVKNDDSTGVVYSGSYAPQSKVQ